MRIYKSNPYKENKDTPISENSFIIAPIKITNIKKWGSEEVVEDDKYTIKLMTLKPGAKVSCHAHYEKQESWILIQGKMLIDLVDLRTGKKHLVELEDKFDSITLGPNVPHSFYCPEGQECDTIFLECSTKDNSSDNYRFTQSTSPEDNNPR